MDNIINENSSVFQVVDTFSLMGKMVISGTVLKGRFNVGDSVNYICDQTNENFTILGMEKDHASVKNCIQGDRCGILTTKNKKIKNCGYIVNKNIVSQLVDGEWLCQYCGRKATKKDITCPGCGSAK